MKIWNVLRQVKFTTTRLIFFGLFSLFIAVIFITNQQDYKRLLAYSSVEHMGILSLGIGVGAPFASLFHMINHSLTKTLLFLVAGQIVLGYRSKKVAHVRGLLKTLPVTGTLFMIGGLAIMGAPPFAPFVSKFLILREMFLNDHAIVASLFLIFLSVIFVTMSKIILNMIQGEKQEIPGHLEKYPYLIFPPLLLAIALFILGFYLPPAMTKFLREIAHMLGGPV